MPSIEACKALLQLDAADALVPHGIGGHGRNCLTWAVDEIMRLRAENENLRRWKALDKPITAAMAIANSHLAGQRETLQKYGGHTSDCRWRGGFDCDCGWQELKRAPGQG